ncbi:MAG: hypothetical protein IPO90_01935 [Flavobacteriales bacterium]|nr:hypothetical protein [Flavobacteriales bacterium]
MICGGGGWSSSQPGRACEHGGRSVCQHAHSPSPKCDLAEVLTTLFAPAQWNGKLVNVDGLYVLSAYPAVAEAKQRIVQAGFTCAALSEFRVFGLPDLSEELQLPQLPPKGQRGWVLPLWTDSW